MALAVALQITTPAMTQAGMILGTAAYMAPEQARGKPVDRGEAPTIRFEVEAPRGGVLVAGRLVDRVLRRRETEEGGSARHAPANIV